MGKNLLPQKPFEEIAYQRTEVVHKNMLSEKMVIPQKTIQSVG